MTLASHAVGRFSVAPRIPGDKSITHRAYLLGLLAEGEYRVTGANAGQDCAATREAVRDLGTDLRHEEGACVVQGAGGRLRTPSRPLDLGNSGTGFRLLLGALAGQSFPVTLVGDASLSSRPMSRVLDPLRAMGVEASDRDGRAPVTVRGGDLTAFQGRVPVRSAQVKSALLLAGIQAVGETRLEGVAGTRDHTERMMRWFGAAVTEDDLVRLEPGPLRGRDVHVPGDPSAGAFFAAAAAIVPGARVELDDVSLNPTRTAFFDTLGKFGADVVCEMTLSDPEPAGRVCVTGGARLRGIDIGPGDVVGLIDELPVLAAVAAFADGETTVRGASELRWKESDRLASTADALRAMGVEIEVLADGWRIRGSAGRPIPGGEVRSLGDHRVGMAALVAGLHSKAGVRLADDPKIETSDPHFVSNLNRIMEHT